MNGVLAVAAGAFVGGCLRFQLSRLSTDNCPAGTLIANTLACLILGAVSDIGYLFLAVGLAGALSTMSTFIKELASMRLAPALAYAFLTMACGVVAFHIPALF
ncbi:CrcB family protein [Staphylococcus chromogenes]|nr:CrcB family protein [Staphylococcus chromogenes]